MKKFIDIDRRTIQVGGIDMKDYPKFCDAYFEFAETIDGRELTEDELDELSTDSDLLYEEINNYIHG